jgi:hypothetical protein
VESLSDILVGEGACGQNFQGHIALKTFVVGTVHHAHTPGANSLCDAMIRTSGAMLGLLPSVVNAVGFGDACAESGRNVCRHSDLTVSMGWSVG